jgi:hypothetical protein
VRFRLYGIGAGRPPISLTWIDPRGRLRRTVAIGRASGPCGRLTTRRRRLLPFAPMRGTWRLRFRSPGHAQVVLRVRVFQQT